MILRQRTFLAAAIKAVRPLHRFDAQASYLQRLRYWHAALMAQAREEPPTEEWPYLCAGARLELRSGGGISGEWRRPVLTCSRYRCFVILIPGYFDVDRVWVAPLLKELRGEYEPGAVSLDSSLNFYALTLGLRVGNMVFGQRCACGEQLWQISAAGMPWTKRFRGICRLICVKCGAGREAKEPRKWA